jgi:Cu(I)-responsive transcriptional regulator
MDRMQLQEHHDAHSAGFVDIGAASRASGVSAKMIRHYEQIGLVPPAARTGAGYRIYGASDVHRLRFVKRARALGFGMAEIGKLLALWSDRGRKSAEVKRLAMHHVAELAHKIAELEEMRGTLMQLVHHCHGDHRPDCPIIEGLAAGDKH